MSTLPTVLVTGASSGIGAATAVKLANSGWRVFAGVRRLSSAPLGEGIEPIQLDVEDRSSISAAAAEISQRLKGQGLNALVNNAGMGQIAPMETVSAEDLEKIFSVNVFGLVAVTQAVLPLLRLARGRIVNLSSVGGMITIPFGGGLCASKHAVEAINDALRMELLPTGIEVIKIRPASVNSPAAGKLATDSDRILSAMTEEARNRYETSIRTFVAKMVEQETAGSPPEEVAEVIYKALTDKHPAAHYLAGKDATLISFLANWVPDHWRDHLLLKRLGLPDHVET